MSNSVHDSHVAHIARISSDARKKKSLMQRYRQNPLSMIWSKLAAVFAPTQVTSEEGQLENQTQSYKLDSTDEHYYYSRFTDRVDPSIYHTIFHPYDRYR
ncbi:hypothetical protein [Iningainema tapete]|nr:hypothetical protein [Iningainema tapete]